jgi:hypothetical protein
MVKKQHKMVVVERGREREREREREERERGRVVCVFENKMEEEE